MFTFRSRRSRPILAFRAAGLAAAVAISAAVPAAAQTPAGFRFSVIGSQPISPSNPTVTIRVEAFFSPGDYAVAGTRFDVLSDDSAGFWSNPRILAPLTTGSNPGVITSQDVIGAVAGQLNFPAAGIFADPGNPIAAWEAEWTSQSFIGRVATFRTHTHRFDVYPDRNSPASTSRLSGFQEAFGEIHIIPAPAGAGVIVAGAVLAMGRRRR